MRYEPEINDNEDINKENYDPSTKRFSPMRGKKTNKKPLTEKKNKYLDDLFDCIPESPLKKKNIREL